MRRLAIFCDGTWNKLDARYPTNVVLGAQAILPVAGAGETKCEQVTYYAEGVGTTWTLDEGLEKSLAGAFGLGLFARIADAYRFLIFNYLPGDDIYIFGFSRGAFTARSLAGLIRKCGILKKEYTSEVGRAFTLYKDREIGVDHATAVEFRERYAQQSAMMDKVRLQGNLPAAEGSVPPVAIKYLGVWDTVGALGVPKYLRFADIFGTAERYNFYNHELSSIVEYARHAVSIDEDRLAFEPSLWSNVDDLNKLPGRQGHYAQLWFPGDHGSVGGGGDVHGLSAAALIWILEGAREAGLEIDWTELKPLMEGRNPLAPLLNVSKRPNPFQRFTNWILFPRGPRTGPKVRIELSDSANTRLDHHATGWHNYRPRSLPDIIAGLDP